MLQEKLNDIGRSVREAEKLLKEMLSKLERQIALGAVGHLFDELREKYLPGIAPSSPFIAMFKGGNPVYVMQRLNIEGKSPEMVAAELVEAFNENCRKEGPSISKEDFEKLQYYKACGSKIPLAK